MITLAAALVFGVPVSIMANTSIEIIEQEIVQPTVVLQGNTLHVNNASGQMLYM